MKLAEEMKCNVGYLDPQIFSATVVQFKSNDVIQAIKKAMNHDYVVGAFNTGGLCLQHWQPLGTGHHCDEVECGLVFGFF